MKKFKRIKTSDEVKAQCAEKNWPVDTTRYDAGYDTIEFYFEHESGVTAVVCYNAFNGRFFGKASTEKPLQEFDFNSDSAAHDGLPWWAALLNFVYTDEDKK